MKDLDTDVRAWESLKSRYATGYGCSMADIYFLAWKGALAPSEAEVFWMFGAGIEFKVWCARQFLAELKSVLVDFKRGVL